MRIINGGVLGEHQGINLPGAALSIPALTEKDRKDLEFGLEHGVDMVALSFVRSAADVREVKEDHVERKSDDVPVIAKLEKPQALDQLEEFRSGRRSNGGSRRSRRGDAAGKSPGHPEARDPTRSRVAQAGESSQHRCWNR